MLHLRLPLEALDLVGGGDISFFLSGGGVGYGGGIDGCEGRPSSRAVATLPVLSTLKGECGAPSPQL